MISIKSDIWTRIEEQREEIERLNEEIVRLKDNECGVDVYREVIAENGRLKARVEQLEECLSKLYTIIRASTEQAPPVAELSRGRSA